MKPALVHILDSFNNGGLEIGIVNLIRRGFYDGFDLHIVGLARGTGESYAAMADLLGQDHVTLMFDAPRTRNLAGPRIVYELVKIFSRVSPAAVVLSSSRSNLLGRVAACFFPQIKVAAFEHSIHARKGLSLLAYQISSLRCDMVLGDDPQTLDEMRYIHWRVRPEYYVPLTILDPGRPRPAQQSPPRFNLLSFGRLEGQKNYIELVRAIALLAAEGYDLTLTIAGKGTQLRDIQDVAHSLGVAERVHLAGFLTDQGVLARLRDQSQIYVQSSLLEGFCLATAEALAAGMVVVATDVGGVRRYGVDNSNMLKIKGFSAPEIAARLRDAMDNYGNIVEPTSLAAIKTAHEEFAEAAVKAHWERARSALMSPRSSAPVVAKA